MSSEFLLTNMSTEKLESLSKKISNELAKRKNLGILGIIRYDTVTIIIGGENISKHIEIIRAVYERYGPCDAIYDANSQINIIYKDFRDCDDAFKAITSDYINKVIHE